MVVLNSFLFRYFKINLYIVLGHSTLNHIVQSQFNHTEMNPVVKECLSEMAYKERPGGNMLKAEKASIEQLWSSLSGSNSSAVFSS